MEHFIWLEQTGAPYFRYCQLTTNFCDSDLFLNRSFRMSSHNNHVKEYVGKVSKNLAKSLIKSILLT